MQKTVSAAAVAISVVFASASLSGCGVGFSNPPSAGFQGKEANFLDALGRDGIVTSHMDQATKQSFVTVGQGICAALASGATEGAIAAAAAQSGYTQAQSLNLVYAAKGNLC